MEQKTVVSSVELTSEILTYKIILIGLDPSVPEGTAKINLANLLRTDETQVNKVLAISNFVLKSGVTESQVKKYIEAVTKAGCICRAITEKIISAKITDAPSEPIVDFTNRDFKEVNKPTPEIITTSVKKPSEPSASRVLPLEVPKDASIKNNVYSSSFQGASDRITSNLGLEKIESFSVTSFFSEVFSKHDPDEVERLLSVGAPGSTPKLSSDMGVMPNPWIFFRILSGTVIAYLVFLYGWNAYGNMSLVPGLIMVGSFAVPFSVLILFFELNTPRNISIIKIVELVVVGGSISLLISLFLSEITPMLGVFGASAAGIVEEIAKLWALLFVIRNVNPERYKYRINALLLGAAIGTGFASFESAGYALRNGMVNSEAMINNIQLRGALSPFGHIVWTAISASAFWIARPHFNSAFETFTSSKFLRLFIIPVSLHFIWNMNYEGPFYVKYIFLGFAAWVVVISLVQSGLNEIRTIAEVR